MGSDRLNFIQKEEEVLYKYLTLLSFPFSCDTLFVEMFSCTDHDIPWIVIDELDHMLWCTAPWEEFLELVQATPSSMDAHSKCFSPASSASVGVHLHPDMPVQHSSLIYRERTLAQPSPLEVDCMRVYFVCVMLCLPLWPFDWPYNIGCWLSNSACVC